LNKGFLAKPVDIWSLGVSLYLYITETFPFDGESEFEIELATKNKIIEYP